MRQDYLLSAMALSRAASRRKHFHRRHAIGLASLISLAPGASAAETNSLDQAKAETSELRLEDLMKLEIPTVEVASRYSQDPNKAPSSVSVITSDEVKKYGYRTLADILQSARGLYTSFNRTDYSLGVRGFNSDGPNNRVLVLVDGHRMNDSLSGGAAIGTDFILDVDLIKQVEISRGPGSSLYGNNAFFGVVNIITRKGRDQEGAGVEVSGEAASFDTYKGRGTFAHKFENGLDVLVSGTYYDSKGPDIFFKQFDTTANNNGVAHNVDDDSYGSFFGSVGFHDFTLQGGYISRDKAVPTPTLGAVFNTPQNRTTDDRSYAALKFAHEFPDDMDVTAQLYYDRQDSTTDGLYDLNPLPLTLNRTVAQAQWWGAEVQLKKTLFDRHIISAGAEYRDDFDQQTRNFDVSPPSPDYQNIHRSTYNYGFYLQADAMVCTNLHINAGFRYDQYAGIDPTVNPRVALIYNPIENSTLKGIYGTAFRAPNFYELNLQSPSKALVPETITTGELAWEQSIGKHLRSSVSGFYNKISDLISLQPDPSGLGVSYQNSTGATAEGVELELQGFWASGLRGRVSYTYQNAEDRASGMHLTDSPYHLGKLNVSVPVVKEKLFAGLEFQYTSQRTTYMGTTASGFGVVNLTLFSQRLVKGLDVAFSVYNLFDRSYGDPAGAFLTPVDVVPQNGRSFLGKITYRF